MRTLSIISVALLLTVTPWALVASAHDGDVNVNHFCANNSAAGALRRVGAYAACRSDEKPVHVGRKLALTDSTGAVIGAAGPDESSSAGIRHGLVSVIVNVGPFWTIGWFARRGEVQWFESSGILHYAEPNCVGDPWMPAGPSDPDLFFTPVVTIGPSFSAYVAEPGAPVADRIVASAREADGSCTDYPSPGLWGPQRKAMFVEHLGYVPPFSLRFVK